MSQFPSISKRFATVTQQTETAIIADSSVVWGTLPKKVYFMAGNIKEISQRLIEKKNDKYPLIALLKDIQETVVSIRGGYSISFNAKLLICIRTLPNYRHDDRRDKNFIPILEPILDKMLTVISTSAHFGMPTVTDMKLKKTNCYFYGTQINNKNQFGDHIDAIYVENLSLTLKEFINC